MELSIVEYRKRVIHNINIISEKFSSYISVTFPKKGLEINFKVDLIEHMISSKEVERIDGNLFIYLTCTEHTMKHPMEGLAGELLQVAVEYWKCIARNQVYFDIYQSNNQIQMFLEDTLKLLDYTDCTSYSKMFDAENIHLAKIYGNPTAMNINNFKKALLLYNEIENAEKSVPSFILDSYNHETQKKLIKLPRHIYYYSGARFTMLPEEGKLVVASNSFEPMVFDIKEGVVDNILIYVKEQLRLPNLINPSSRFFDMLITDIFKLNKSTIEIEKVMAPFSSVLDVEEFEEECAQIVEIFKRQRRSTKAEIAILELNLANRFYRLKTYGYTWYIYAGKKEYKMFPTLYDEPVPQSIMNILSRCLYEETLSL